jgi:hypothetical protein
VSTGSGILGILPSLGNASLLPIPAVAGQVNGGQSLVRVTGLFPTIRPSPGTSATSPLAGPGAGSPHRVARAADSSPITQQSAASQQASLILLVIAAAIMTTWLALRRARRPAGKRRAG